MIKELLQQEISPRKEEEEKVRKSKQFWKVMDCPELSLGPSRQLSVTESTNSSSSESEISLSRKRKYCLDYCNTEPIVQTSIELQLKDPLPLDWEQCLDLESGRMYYLNRNTLKKSWNCPKEQKLDLELNISSSAWRSSSEIIESPKKQDSSNSSNMVAVACLKCHLLVMLCSSSPSCPNCKYVHSLPPRQSPPQKLKTFKKLDTLSLLN